MLGLKYSRAHHRLLKIRKGPPRKQLLRFALVGALQSACSRSRFCRLRLREALEHPVSPRSPQATQPRAASPCSQQARRGLICCCLCLFLHFLDGISFLSTELYMQRTHCLPAASEVQQCPLQQVPFTQAQMSKAEFAGVLVGCSNYKAQLRDAIRGCSRGMAPRLRLHRRCRLKGTRATG